jgi:CHAD domain-containing protein
MARRVNEEGRRDIEHALAIMRRHLDAMKAHEPGVRLGDDPEELHQMRTATRRLRALLRAVRETFDPEEIARLRSELKWLGLTLGAARDADVQRDYLRGLSHLTRGERAAVQGLLRALERERARTRQSTLSALDTPRYKTLLHDLDQLIEHPPLVNEDFSLRDIAARAFRKLRRVVDDLPGAQGLGLSAFPRRVVQDARNSAMLRATFASRQR